MNFKVFIRSIFIVTAATLMLSACATKTATLPGQIQGDVYTGTDTVEYLAKGVPDRVFFATNESVLTTASRDTLRKQAAWMRTNDSLSFTIEGHADERGTREYNLAFDLLIFWRVGSQCINDTIVNRLDICTVRSPQRYRYIFNTGTANYQHSLFSVYLKFVFFLYEK